MAYLLSGSTIRRPNSMQETNTTQFAEVRTLDGQFGRDYFGDNKRIWTLEFRNTQPSDYSTIKTIYNTYLSTGTEVAWEVTESNYTVAATTVHVDLFVRGFTVQGSTYLSNFTLTLTEV